MGKRKSSAKPQKKIKQKLDTTFTCLFCNHESSISCTIDKKTNIGTLTCKICGQNFQCPINSLTEPVDIYSNWIDACEAVADEESGYDADERPGAGDAEEYDDVSEEKYEEERRSKVKLQDEDDEDDEDELFN